MDDRCTFTYQTRLKLDPKASKILEEYAELYNFMLRSLFAKVCQGQKLLAQKKAFLKQFDVTARQFNAVRMQLQGKIEACKALRVLHIKNIKERIASLEKRLLHLAKSPKKSLLYHQKKRRLEILQRKRTQLQKDQKEEKIRLCFGGKKLFRSQFHLKENRYASHEEWKRAWKSQRNSEFYVLGSKDETAGNQSCVATLNPNHSFDLRLRLPHALAKEHGRYQMFEEVTFKYGHAKIRESLELGHALSYRFKKDSKGWILFLSTQMSPPKKITQKALGAIGVDINANHLALTETDRFGNCLLKKTLPLNTYGKTSEQVKALTGNVSSEIVLWAKTVKKPLVLERLDFQKKKASLKENSLKKGARMLSSFAYQKIIQTLQAKAYKEGIETYSVNPAFTSVIGSAKFSKRYGLSKHHAAAFCIARRLYGYSEQPPRSPIQLISEKKGWFTLNAPVRMRHRPVWSFWGKLSRKIQTAHAAHFRAMVHRSKDPPKGDLCDGKLLKVEGEIPSGESLTTLLG